MMQLNVIPYIVIPVWTREYSPRIYKTSRKADQRRFRTSQGFPRVNLVQAVWRRICNECCGVTCRI